VFLVKEEFGVLWKKKTAFRVHVKLIKQAVMTAKQVEILNMKCVWAEWRDNRVGRFRPKTNYT
jgi:hypothetical protein